jgi:hypothetical protein
MSSSALQPLNRFNSQWFQPDSYPVRIRFVSGSYQVRIRFVSGHAFMRAVKCCVINAPSGAVIAPWSFTTACYAT